VRSTSGSLAGIGTLLLFAFTINRLSDIDLEIARWFYVPAEGGFPLRSAWLWATVLHDGSKLVAVLVWLALCLWLAGLQAGRLMGRIGEDRSVRPFLVFTVLVSIASAAAVAWIKSRSAHSCPWMLTLFGGQFQYFRLLEAVPPGAGPGRCLPSGHASVGFMWIAAIFAARRWLPDIVSIVTLVVLGVGTMVSVAQVVRGEHFLSHVLLTAALCWTIAWFGDVLYGLLRTARASVPSEQGRGR